MTDKVQKIREEVERLYNQSLADENRQTERGLERAANVSYGKSKACNELISFIDSLQEEPKKCMYSKDDYTDEDRKVLCDGCEEECKYNKSDDFTIALAECINKAQCAVVDPMAHAEIWKDELIKLAKCEEPVSEEWIKELRTKLDSLSKEDFEKVFDKYAIVFNEEPVSEDLGEAAENYATTDEVLPNGKVMINFQAEKAFRAGANWQKEQLLAKAVDGDITFDYYGDDDKTYGCIAHDSFCLEDFGLKDMDKVKVIVIKEE